jgi:hypothetical protein
MVWEGDRLAALTRTPDASFAELRALYKNEERLRVPGTVHNAVLKREDTVDLSGSGSPAAAAR